MYFESIVIPRIVLVTLTEPIERMMQSAGGRQVSFAPFAVYIITTFLNKKTANSTDSNKVAPEKKTQKNMVILDYFKFLSANL